MRKLGRKYQTEKPTQKIGTERKKAVFLVLNEDSIDYLPFRVVAVVPLATDVSRYELHFTIMAHPLLDHSKWCNFRVKLQCVVIASITNLSLTCPWINCCALYWDTVCGNKWRLPRWEHTESVYSELVIAWESATITCIWQKLKRQKYWKAF